MASTSKKDASSSRAVDLRAKFATRSDVVEDRLKTDTRGLVTLDDFKAKREQLKRTAAEESARRDALKRSRDMQEKRRRIRKANTATLSFANDEEDTSSNGSGSDRLEEDEGQRLPVRHRHGPPKPGQERQPSSSLVRGLGKDPSAQTRFLPDAEREAAEKVERERLKIEWMLEQERIKEEQAEVVYSFWDGSGHRRKLKCTKGTTVGRFLSLAQNQFAQLRAASADTLMFVKEDLIIPYHYSFYDFIVSNARGKSGPLFDFSVQDDVRLLTDASREKQDVHAAKVVERRWYERNKHIFPASRWTIFDPLIDYGRYTVH